MHRGGRRDLLRQGAEGRHSTPRSVRKESTEILHEKCKYTILRLIPYRKPTPVSFQGCLIGETFHFICSLLHEVLQITRKENCSRSQMLGGEANPGVTAAGDEADGGGLQSMAGPADPSPDGPSPCVAPRQGPAGRPAPGRARLQHAALLPKQKGERWVESSCRLAAWSWEPPLREKAALHLVNPHQEVQLCRQAFPTCFLHAI